MAWVQKRTFTDKAGKPQTRWDVRYRGPDRRTRTKTFRRKVDADAYAATIGADLVRRQWVDPDRGRLTLSDWWDAWWPTVGNLRASTRARDASYWSAYIAPDLGAVRLDALDHDTLTAWVAGLSNDRGLAPSTVHKVAQIAGKTLKAAVRAGRLQANPLETVDLPKIERSEMRFLTPAEVMRLADTIDARYRPLVLVAAYGGLRIGELAALRRQRITVKAGRVSIDVAETAYELDDGTHLVGPPKTRAGRRTVPLPRVAGDPLIAHLGAIDAQRDALVFPAPDGGTLRANNFRRRFWRPATKAADLEGLRIHDLRHTAVALWIAAGANPLEVARRAGHGSVSVVFDRYGHLLPGHDDALSDALDALAEDAQESDTAGPERDHSAIDVEDQDL